MNSSDLLFDSTVRGLGQALDFRLLKQNVHAANIANADTPEYRAQKLDFEEALHNALDPHDSLPLATAAEGHFSSGKQAPQINNPDIHENPDGVVNESGNSVQMEREMSELAQNRILYNAAINAIKKKFGLLKYAAVEGGR